MTDLYTRYHESMSIDLVMVHWEQGNLAVPNSLRDQYQQLIEQAQQDAQAKINEESRLSRELKQQSNTTLDPDYKKDLGNRLSLSAKRQDMLREQLRKLDLMSNMTPIVADGPSQDGVAYQTVPYQSDMPLGTAMMLWQQGALYVRESELPSFRRRIEQAFDSLSNLIQAKGPVFAKLYQRMNETDDPDEVSQILDKFRSMYDEVNTLHHQFDAYRQMHDSPPVRGNT